MEIESLQQLREYFASEPMSLAGVTLQGLDLSDAPDLVGQLAAADVAGLVVLGGEYPPKLLHILTISGATVLPAVAGVPFDPYRAQLYSADELYAGIPNGYDTTCDAICYRWFTAHRDTRSAAGTTFSAIHDASITDALEDLLHRQRHPTVAVMGGHGLRRNDNGYTDAAELGRQLAAAGASVATGGGPGAMEAVNLGAAFGGRGRTDLAAAIAQLATVPDFHDVASWASVALPIARELGPACETGVVSLGIPTWFYGHEPPNVFGDRIAKYFSNALREDVLLGHATGGIVVLPGAAGTVQEIFQAATRAYYAADQPPPIVLLGSDYWTNRLSAWQLLQQLADGRQMQHRIALCDNSSQAVAALTGFGVPLRD